MLRDLQRIDQEITLWINGLHCEWTDPLMQLLSDKLVWIPFYLILAGFLVARLGWKRALVGLLALALTFALCDRISDLVKHAVERLRPLLTEQMVSRGLHVLEPGGGKFGFFSSHASNVFGLALCAWILFRTEPDRRQDRVLRWVLFLWATGVSLSRIFVGKHYFGDVLVGTLLGLAVGAAVGMAARRLIRLV